MIAEALNETMATIDETKVREGYQHDNCVSPNKVYAKFVHGETRPVDGILDPPCHIHVFSMSATFDDPIMQSAVGKYCSRAVRSNFSVLDRRRLVGLPVL